MVLADTAPTALHPGAPRGNKVAVSALNIFQGPSSPNPSGSQSASRTSTEQKPPRHSITKRPCPDTRSEHRLPSRSTHPSRVSKPSQKRDMNLTPIRVRGKRRTPVTKAPAVLQQRQPKPKRTLSTVMAARQESGRPSLENLPSEILERILLYSSNLSLPQASPIISVKLSEKATLIRFFIWAFHETWDEWFGIPTSKTVMPGAHFGKEEKKRPEADYRLQTALLKQPWATIDFILQAQQTWADNYGSCRWYQHSTPWNQEPDEVHHSHHGGTYHFNSRECFEVDYEQALKWPAFRVESLPWGTQEVHPKTKVPVNLLTGPWDDEKLRRLFWLTRGGMMAYTNGDAPPWEIKLQFLRNAILDVEKPQVLAINCLMGSWVFQDLPPDIVRKEMAGLDRRLQWGDDSEQTKFILQRTRNAMSMFLDYRQMRRSSV